MPIDKKELQDAVEDLFGISVNEIKAGLGAGGIAVKRDKARKLLKFATGRSAAKLATFDDAMEPILNERRNAEISHNQIITQIESALKDLENDEDASIPSDDQVSQVITGYSE